MTKGLDKTMTIGCTCTAPRCSMNGFSQRVTSLSFVRPFFGRIILVNLTDAVYNCAFFIC